MDTGTMGCCVEPRGQSLASFFLSLIYPAFPGNIPKISTNTVNSILQDQFASLQKMFVTRQKSIFLKTFKYSR